MTPKELFHKRVRQAGLAYLIGGVIVVALHMMPGVVSEERIGAPETAALNAGSPMGADTETPDRPARSMRDRRRIQLGIGMGFVIAFGLILVLPFDWFYTLLCTALTLSNTVRGMILLCSGLGFHISLRKLEITRMEAHWQFLLSACIIFGVTFMLARAAWAGYSHLNHERNSKETATSSPDDDQQSTDQS